MKLSSVLQAYLENIAKISGEKFDKVSFNGEELEVSSFFEKYPNSPFHDLVALNYLLAKSDIEEEIKQKLENYRNGVEASILALHHLLETPHYAAVGPQYEMQEKKRKDFFQAAVPSNVNERIFALALLYSLSHMDDPTFAALKTGEESRLEAINRIQSILIYQQLNEKNNPVEEIRSSVAALITLESYRVAMRHATSAVTLDADKHEAKNFRFVIEMDALLKQSGIQELLKSNSLKPEDETREESQLKNSLLATSRVSDESLIKILMVAGDQKLYQPKMLGEHWKDFLTNLVTSTIGPAALMTKTLIKFSECTANLKPLQDWCQVLVEYCEDKYQLLSEEEKTSARIELELVTEWLVERGQSLPAKAASINSKPSAGSSIASNQESSSNLNRRLFLDFQESESFTMLLNSYFSTKTSAKEKCQLLMEIIDIALKISEVENLIVNAPQAKAALAEWKNKQTNCIDDVYPHVFSLLQATVFATRWVRATEEMKKSITDATAILVSLQKLLVEHPYFAQVHQRMIKSQHGDDSSLDVLTQKDTSRCSHHEKSILTAVDHHFSSSSLAKNVMSNLSFKWSHLYKAGDREKNSRTLEQRGHYEMLSATVLEKILDNPLKELLIEERWLLVKAISDYHKKNVETPFYRAIQLLAVTGQECDPVMLINSPKAKEQEKVICNLLYARVFNSLKKHEAKLTHGQMVFEEEALSCFSELETSFSLIHLMDLLERHIDNENEPTDATLNEKEIKFILNNFDAQFSNNGRPDKKWLALLDKVFKGMHESISSDSKRRFTVSTGWMPLFSSRTELSPVGFDDFMKCIAPKDELRPDVFDRYCAFQSSQSSRRTELPRHEANFIMQHIRHLYDDQGRFMGESSNEEAVIGLISGEWDKQLLELENNKKLLTLEMVKPHLKLIMDKNGNLLTFTQTNDTNIPERIAALDRDARAAAKIKKIR